LTASPNVWPIVPGEHSTPEKPGRLLLSLCIAGTFVIVGTGCASHHRGLPKPLPPDITPQAEVVPPAEPPPLIGSLWTEGRSSLFTDHRARIAGDIVTIKITENAKASKTAKTDLTKKNDVKFGIPSLFGLETAANARRDRVEAANTAGAAAIGLDLNSLLAASSEKTFAGDGSTERSGKLEATLTAVVTRVLPSGNLFIEGRRRINLNDENQYLLLTGIIRPEDISPDNTVPSSMIADASISYYGEGRVADQQRQGWFSTLMDKAWPF
jgi:flagellar L-ring protein precursor FlgH